MATDKSDIETSSVSPDLADIISTSPNFLASFKESIVSEIKLKFNDLF